MSKLLLIMMATLLFCVTGCATSPPGPPPPRYTAPELVVDKLWGWEGTETSVELFVAPESSRFTLRLLPDGATQVVFECNRGTGRYRIADRKLSFSPIASTKMACARENVPLEQLFSKQLQGTTGFYVENGMLFLETAADGGTMRFRELKP